MGQLEILGTCLQDFCRISAQIVPVASRIKRLILLRNLREINGRLFT